MTSLRCRACINSMTSARPGSGPPAGPVPAPGPAESERATQGRSARLPQRLRRKLQFRHGGLLPVVTCCHAPLSALLRAHRQQTVNQQIRAFSATSCDCSMKRCENSLKPGATSSAGKRACATCRGETHTCHAFGRRYSSLRVVRLESVLIRRVDVTQQRT